MAVRTPRRLTAPSTGIGVTWSNPPRRRLTIEPVDAGRVSRRTPGLGGSLDVDEAAAVLRMPAARVHEAIGAAGTLTAQPGGRLVLDDAVEYTSDRRLITRSRKVEAAVRAGRQGMVRATELPPLPRRG